LGTVSSIPGKPNSLAAANIGSSSIHLSPPGPTGTPYLSASTPAAILPSRSLTQRSATIKAWSWTCSTSSWVRPRLKEVAKVYKAAQAAGRPVRIEVEQHFGGIPSSTAARWIKAARKYMTEE